MRFSLTLIFIFLSGCVTNTFIPPPATRAQEATHLAKQAGWKAHTIRTKSFTLKACGSHASTRKKVLTIYIEGDGLAWLSSDTPSDNPTPINPTALKMALHNKKDNMIYLARPCQYVFGEEWRGCNEAYWTNLRFAPEVIDAMNQAVTNLKKYYHAQQIILVGYSGGGTIAALIAARRDDVIQLITVAAVLDVKQWVQQQSLTPLNGSLDPADEWEKLISVPQTHWVGGKDEVAPKENAYAFAKHFPEGKKPEIRVIPDFDHVHDW